MSYKILYFIRYLLSKDFKFFMVKLDYKIIFLLYNMIVYKSKINFYLKLIFIKIHVSLYKI